MSMSMCLQKKFGPHFEGQSGRHNRLFDNRYDAIKINILQLT